MDSGTSAARAEALDLIRVSDSVRRHLLPVSLLALTAAGLTALISRQAPPTYQASSSMVAVRSDSGNSLIDNTLVTAPTLPTGALQEALGSPEVLREIRQGLPSTTLSPAERLDLNRRLDQSRQQEGRSLTLISRLDEQRNGVYEVQARASTPGAASAFADATVRALMAWDTRRATASVTRARQSVEQRLAAITAQLGGTPRLTDRADLVASRAVLARDREQLRVLEQAAVGTLTRVGSARQPTEPSSPSPLRDALVAGVLSVLLLLPLAVLRDLARRRVRLVDDLHALNLPVLTVLPRFRPAVWHGGISSALQDARVQRQAAFLRVGSLALLPRQPLQVIAVSGVRRGDGATTVAALLAASLADWGSRVLLIEAGPLSSAQPRLWRARSDGASHPVPVAPRVDLWRQPALARLVAPPEADALREGWRQQYDVVVLDCPPAAEVADTLTLMAGASGVLLVTSAGSASQQELRQTLERARLVSANVLGFVLNRAGTGAQTLGRVPGLPATPGVSDTRPSEALPRLP